MVVPAKCWTNNGYILPSRNSICICHTRTRWSNRTTKNEDAGVLRLFYRLFHHHLEPSSCVDMESDGLASSDGYGGFCWRTRSSWSRWSSRPRNYPSDLARGKKERTRNQPSGPSQTQPSLADVVDSSSLGGMVRLQPGKRPRVQQ